MIRTLYSSLLKIEENDDKSISFEGIASAETVDAAGETVMASAMKAALPDFLRYGTGALREMHQLVAAGTIDEATVDDASGETRVSGTVIDDQVCKKLRAGVYKGLSIGGKVLARDPKNAKVITGIKLTEISLVDRPSCPEAVIDLWKAEKPGSSGLGFTSDQMRDAIQALPAAERAMVLVKAAIAHPRGVDDLVRRRVVHR